MKYVIYPALALALAACGADNNPPTDTAQVEDTYGNPVAESEAILAENDPLEGSELAPAATPDHILPQALLDEWAGYVKAGDYELASSVWGRDAEADERMPEDIIAARGPYKTIDIDFDDSEIEGAAGSEYFETTMVVTATTEDGNDIRFEGPITLKRVNDVPGAVEAELRWHYDRGALALTSGTGNAL